MGIGDFGVTFSIFAPPRSYLACVQDTGCIFGHKSIFWRKLFFDLEILVSQKCPNLTIFSLKIVIFHDFWMKIQANLVSFGS